MNHTLNILKLYPMNFKKIEQSTIISIALIVTILINLLRILQLFDVISAFGTSMTAITVGDVLIRVSSLFIFSWVVLNINTNWSFFYGEVSKIKTVAVATIVNGILYAVFPFLIIYMYPIFMDNALKDSDEIILYVVYLIVLLILIFIAKILRYQLKQKEDTAEKELLKQQKLESELAALKNQINPHFLFNSLNSLNSLVRDNKDAKTFISKLSFLYRYILQSASIDLVTIEEELKFLDSYVYLIKTRYRENFEITIDVEETILQKTIPILGVQLLVENAVKHNEISINNPLLVKVFSKDNFLIIENKIKPRTSFVDSTGNGLANLDKRYSLTKNKKISIENKNDTFRVKLPL